MDRREFLKLSVVCGVSMSTPLKLYNPDSNETKFLKYLMENYPADKAVTMIKMYGFDMSKGAITVYFRKLVKAQPEFIAWLRSKINVKNKNFNKETMRYHKRRTASLTDEEYYVRDKQDKKEYEWLKAKFYLEGERENYDV